MSRLVSIALLGALVAASSVQPALAQDLCSDLRAILGTAKDGFKPLRGEKYDESYSIEYFEVRRGMKGNTYCDSGTGRDGETYTCQWLDSTVHAYSDIKAEFETCVLAALTRSYDDKYTISATYYSADADAHVEIHFDKEDAELTVTVYTGKDY